LNTPNPLPRVRHCYKVYVVYYPCFSIIRDPPPPPLITESKLYLQNSTVDVTSNKSYVFASVRTESTFFHETD